MFFIKKVFLAHLLNIIIILLFINSKHSQIFFYDIFQVRIIYIFILITFFIFVYDKFIVRTFKYKVNYQLFALLNIYVFLISILNQNLNLSFFKQIVGINIFGFAAYYLVYKFSLNFIFKRYLKYSIFFVIIGLFIYFLNFLILSYFYFNGLEINDIKTLFDLFEAKQNQLSKFFLFFLFNDELYRLKSFSGESNSFGVILLPALNYFLYKLNNRKYVTFFILILTTCILTFSVFTYAGIFLIFIIYFFSKKNINKKFLLFLPLLTVFICLNNFSMFKKVFDTYFFLPKIQNYSVSKDHKKSFLFSLNNPVTEKIKKINNDEISSYKFSLLDKFLINNYSKLFSKKYGGNRFDNAYDRPGNFLQYSNPNGYVINTSSFAVLVNYYVFINSSVKEKIFGTGLGSFKKTKQFRVKSFYIPGAISDPIYINLGNKDGKFLLNRLVIELGLLFIIFILFMFYYVLFNTGKKNNKLLILSSLIFLITKLIHHGHYMQFEIFLFLILIIRAVKNDLYSS